VKAGDGALDAVAEERGDAVVELPGVNLVDEGCAGHVRPAVGGAGFGCDHGGSCGMSKGEARRGGEEEMGTPAHIAGWRSAEAERLFQVGPLAGADCA
jgi:hypothetical protein